MGRTRSLQYQMTETISMAFKPGIDKHSLKKDHNGGNPYNHVASYKSREALCKFSKKFAKYIKTEYPHINYVCELTPNHFEEYFELNKANWNNRSIKTNFTLAKKMMHLCNRRFRFKTNMNEVRLPISTRGKLNHDLDLTGRCTLMSEKEFNIIYEDLCSRSSFAQYAIFLTRILGLRNQESVTLTPLSFIREDESHVSLHTKNENAIIAVGVTGKGGRYREIPVDNPSHREYLEKLADGKEPNERLIPIKAASVSSAIRLALKRNGLSEKFKLSSQHSIRKLYATLEFIRIRDEKYRDEISKGLNEKEAMNRAKNYAYYQVLSIRLGHGRRYDLRNVYIKESML